MSPETFLENFGHLADAPNGVQKLREMILQLAVRGRLVPQDPRDEPASVLLERIAVERRRLEREGKIRKSKPLPPVDPDHVLFAVPEGWEWTRLSNAAVIEMGNSPPGDTYNVDGEGVPLINGPSEFSSDPLGRTVLSQFTTAPTKMCRPGDLLICVRGATTGRTNIAGFEACIGRGVALISAGELQPYVNRYVASQRSYIFAQGSGSTFPSISYRHLADLLVPLPPLAEQRRVVAKADQLMALCDELETQHQQRQEQRVRLNGAALHRLTTAQDADDMERAWERVRAHVDLLYDVPETVGELRQAILQLAVRGKLVPQDPDDEPASVLLEKIAAERRRREREGKIRRSKPHSPINADEKPFEVPAGWEWARLGNLGEFMGGGTPSKANPSFWAGDIPWISPKDMKEVRIRFATDHISTEALERSAVRLIPAGAVLMVVRGMILVRTFPVAITERQVTVNQDMKALILHERQLDDYLLLSLRALEPFVLQLVERSSHGTCRLDSETIEGLRIPLPPLAEQRRIAAKADQLLALCDELEGKLTRSHTKAEHLASAVVHHLTAA